MDLYTSTDCWNDMSRARYTQEGAAIKKAECEALEAQEQANIPGDECPPNCPLGELPTEAEQICKDKMRNMNFKTAEDMNHFIDTCVAEQNQLLYPEGDIEGEEIEIEPQTAGFGDNKLLIWLVIGGVALWYLNKQGFLK